MAYLTQYSSSVPVIKYHIDQSVMTIGQNIEMDICVPEDGIAENHAAVEAIKHGKSYRFIIKSTENEPHLKLNGETVSHAELQNDDWLVIGDVEFQFTDDGLNSIVEETLVASTSAIEEKSALIVTGATKINNDSEALKLIRVLKEGLQDNSKPLTTKEFIANSRQSRRRLAF